VAVGGETQPGGRAPAPGDLGLLQAFINTHYDLEVEHGAEVLASPAALGAWLSRRGLLKSGRPKAGDLRRAIQIREGLRALARTRRDPAALDRLNHAADGLEVEVRFGPDGPRFLPLPAGSVNGALGALLAIAARAMIDGSWERLKICPGVDCGWAFYDHSRSQSGRWCSMAVCGGRAKARAHYRRRRSRGG
jgi:predicted RNA-binding Zn ribbon-like protein